MSEVTAKRTIADAVANRITSGQCLLCDKMDNARRGLCINHYQEFFRRIRELRSKEDRAEFEAANIREGRILAVGQLRGMKRKSPFVAP